MFKQLTQLVAILSKAGQFLQYAQAVHAALSQLVAHLHGSALVTTAPSPAVASPAPVVTPAAPSSPATEPAPYVFAAAPARPLDEVLASGTINGLNVAQ